MSSAAPVEEKAWGRNCTGTADCPVFCHQAGCPSVHGYAGHLAHNSPDDGEQRRYAIDGAGLTHIVLHPGHDHEILPQDDGGCTGLPDCPMHPLV